MVLLTVESRTGEGAYSFVCPLCEEVVQKSADRKIVELLRTAGVETAVAGSSQHPSRWRPEPPPFTLDDLIDFHFLLAGDDWLHLLTAAAE